MTDRVYDPYLFHATVAGIDWLALARQQNRQQDLKAPPVVQLRWLVNAAIGVPDRPFTVWTRSSRTVLTTLEVSDSPGEQFVASLLPEPVSTLEVDLTPDSPTATTLLAGFADVPSAATLCALTSAVPGGPTTLRIRASGIRQFVVSGGSVTAVRGETVRDALAADWKPFELVGLPVDDTWQGSTYAGDEQGLVDALTTPADAARQRLERGLAPFGWPALTAANRAVPPWQPPDPDRWVAAAQAGTLAQSRPLFAPGVPPAGQVAIRPLITILGPTRDGRTAAGTSTAGVPLLGALLVGAGADSAAALGLGFGTAYPVPPGDARLVAAPARTDYLVTASYPDGVTGDGNGVELAVVLPWPSALHRAPGPPAALVAERAGLLLPASDVAPWTETVRLSFTRFAPSVALERPTVGAFARYPATPGPADLGLEPDPAGGFRSLLLAARPDPHGNQNAFADAVGTELPTDLSARTIGHAVAVADVYGVWSAWSDVDHSSAAPPYPIPQVVSVRADAVFAGTTSCPATISSDIVVDWQSRTPSTLEVRLFVCPVGYPGAPLPAGAGPFAAPPGCVARTITLGVSGDTLVAPSPDVTVDYLSADATSTVDPGDPTFPAATRSADGDSRRYRITLTGASLDFAAGPHYAVAGWARELCTTPGAPWGDVAAAPVVAYAGSPVPPTVVFVAPPAVPLGSLPDADNRSHVLVDTSGVFGAVSVTVWTASEARLRTAAGEPAELPTGLTLPQRYLALQNAYDSLTGSAQRAPFTRYGTYPAGTDSVDVLLPRGTREISLFAVTAVNAAGVESAWPTSHAVLQAATAPRTVAPTMPVLSAAFDDAGAVGVTLAARCELPIVAFELYATRLADAATDVASMGPPLQVIAVPPAAADPSDVAPGPLSTVTVSGLAIAADWRPLRLRAVAVAAPDGDTGSYGVRSPASPVAVLSAPPSTPPDLSALTVHGWGTDGTDGTGVRVLFASALPLDVGTVRVTAGSFDGGGALTQLPLVALPPASPPAGAASGTVVRGARTAGVTAYEAWFTRPSDASAVVVEVVLRDALGRVSVRSATVPAGAIDPPRITVLSTSVSAPYLLVRWTTDTPPDDGSGPCVLTVVGSSTRFVGPFGLRTVDELSGSIRIPFPPPRRVVVSGTFAMPSIRDAAVSPLQPIAVDVVRTAVDGRTIYTTAVRVPAPAAVTLTITTPAGQVGSERVGF